MPAKAGWAGGAWRLPQVFCLLCHPSRGFLLGQHSSLPALLRALGTISHLVPISTGPCYQREEAGITGKNMDFVGMSSALLEAIQQRKTQERKRREVPQGNASSEPCFGHPNVQAKMQSWMKLLPLVMG